jgi:hypothetical protein
VTAIARAGNRRDAPTSTTTAEPYDREPHTLARATFRSPSLRLSQSAMADFLDQCMKVPGKVDEPIPNFANVKLAFEVLFPDIVRYDEMAKQTCPAAPRPRWERVGGSAMPRKSEKEFELEAKVVALEYILKQCFWNIIFLRIKNENGDDDLAIREAKLFRRLFRQRLKKASFRGTDPALSDHLSALVHDHVERVFEEIVQEMEAKRRRGLSSRGNF